MTGQVSASIPPPEHPHYSYSPTPITMEPPIGHDTMLHCFRCPEVCSKSDFCLKRFPGHLYPDVTVDNDSDEGIAWGVELVEGREWAFLWIISFLVMSCSVAFGVVYTVVMRDVQGGFTVAGFIVAFGASLVGTLQITMEVTG